MLKRFQISICHPSRIGLFYKDTFGKAIIYLISLFLIYTGICAATTFGYDNFTYSDAQAVSELIYRADTTTIEFDTNTDKITGTPVKYRAEGLIVNFLVNENYSNTIETVLRFNETSVEVLYAGYIIKEVQYSKINVDSFKLEDVRLGDDKATCDFQDMIDYILEQVDTEFGFVNLFNAVLNGLTTLVMVYIISLVASYFSNPSIGGKIRAKLCLYCVGVYYVFMLMAVLFNVSWLTYVAMFAPVLYANRAFSHIIRVDKKISKEE